MKKIVNVEVTIDESKLTKTYSEDELTNIAQNFFHHVLRQGVLNTRGVDFEPDKENVSIAMATSFKIL